jgi:VCBS repeat-containing protein
MPRKTTGPARRSRFSQSLKNRNHGAIATAPVASIPVTMKGIRSQAERPYQAFPEIGAKAGLWITKSLTAFLLRVSCMGRIDEKVRVGQLGLADIGVACCQQWLFRIFNLNGRTSEMVLATWLSSLKTKAHGRSRSFTRSASRSQAASGFVERLEERTLLSANPVADTYATDENTVLTTAAPGVLTNDDLSGLVGTAEAVLVDAPAEGSLTLNPDGSFSYDPTTSSTLDALGAGATSLQSFTYLVHDTGDNSDSATASVDITVTGVNDAPLANDDAYSYTADTALTIAAPGVLGNDTDAEGDTLTASLVSDVGNGTLTLNADGSFTYTPDAGFTGTDAFSYTASDGSNVSNEATVFLSLAPVNQAPFANDDQYATDQDTPLTVDAPGVLGNDTDAEGDTLTATLVSDVANGTLVLNEDGSFTYTPNSGFTGTDTFTYTASDGTNTSNEATVTITVGQAVNQAPVAVDDLYATVQDTPLTVDAPGVLGNDTDAEGDTLTATLVSDVANGTLVLNEDGSFTYTPNSGFTGTDTFTYTASDGTNTSNEATVTITVGQVVNQAPVANDDQYATDQDTPLTVDAPGVLGNDTDAEGDTLTATLVSDVANGTLVLNEDGSFTYTPNSGFTGTDTFTYTASDGTNTSNEATVTITVTPTGPANNTVVFDEATCTLTVSNTEGDVSIIVTTINGNVAVLFDGQANTSFGDVLASSLCNLVVNAGSGANFVDLRGMGPGAFGSLVSVTVSLGDGDDTFQGSQFGESIDAGAGNDYVNAKGGDDTVAGGDGDDILLGGGGNDSLEGGAGSDWLVGNGGRDTLLGGADDDKLVAGASNDSVEGGDGNDLVHGGAGSDTIKGGLGDDTLRGDAGDDLISGNDGNDVLLGNAGNDTMAGNEGNDSLLGGAGRDLLLGGPGDDRLKGQGGLDTIAGGDGNDSIADMGMSNDLVDDAFTTEIIGLDTP